MSRMAAKFGSGGGGPSVPMLATGPDSHQASKGKVREAKKFCTRGEEYFEFLKGLGYQPSKHQQAEHFECLFQDDAFSSFARKLMSTLKTQHCVLPGEIEKYETLQKQGLLIYGSDLEEAVSRRRAINEMYSQQTIERLAEQKQMEKEFELQEGELKRLSKLEAAFAKQLLVWEVKEKQVAHMAAVIQNLIREEERDAEIDLKLLNKKMSELDTYVVQLKKDMSVHKPQTDAANYICQIEGRRLLENEETLFETIQEMVKKHGTSLIMKDAGYGVEETETLSVENMQEVFAQYETEFERLKHSIIFEKVVQLSLEIDRTGQEEGIRDNYQDCYNKTVQLWKSGCEARSKSLNESVDALRAMEAELEKEHEDLLDYARKTTLTAVNKAFSGLINIKTRSKKKLYNFFAVATTSLKAQQVRVSLIRNLVKAEGKLYGRLLSNIEGNLAGSSRYSKKLLKAESTKVSDLTEDVKMLYSFMGHLGVSNPMDVITSVPETLTFARKASSELRNQYWNSIEEQQSQFQARYKHLMKVIELSQTQDSSSDGCEMRIKELEEHNDKLEEQRLKTKQCNILLAERERQSEENKNKCDEILRLRHRKISGKKQRFGGR